MIVNYLTYSQHSFKHVNSPYIYNNFAYNLIYSEIDNNPYIQFPIKDYPGSYEFKETNAADVQAIKNCGSLIYVIDAQQ